jgi:hypothetical protein
VKGCGVGATGRKRQLEVEDAYWQLILAGVGTVEACRQVGITRKTGYRRRAERGGIPPVRVAGDSSVVATLHITCVTIWGAA